MEKHGGGCGLAHGENTGKNMAKVGGVKMGENTNFAI